MTALTSKGNIKELKARFGTKDSEPPDSYSLDRAGTFDHATSSPTYPQSNDKPENAVKTAKRLFKKNKEFFALLE